MLVKAQISYGTYVYNKKIAKSEDSDQDIGLIFLNYANISGHCSRSKILLCTNKHTYQANK